MTIRDHLEAIRDLHCCASDECVNEGVDCTAWSHALDALALLDHARWITAYDQGSPPVKGRLVLDPPVVSGARRTQDER